MPSSISHAMAAVALGAALAPRHSIRPLIIAGVLCAVLPDVDALPRLIGRADLALFGGHRAFTHSILFALATGLIVAMIAPQRWGFARWRVFTFITLATVSHGVLDAFTDFGTPIGVAFLSPFLQTRFISPWRPIAGEFSELLWVLAPLTAATVAVLRMRRMRLGILRAQPVRLELQATAAAAAGQARLKDEH
jgi:inner membrane protein